MHLGQPIDAFFVKTDNAIQFSVKSRKITFCLELLLEIKLGMFSYRFQLLLLIAVVTCQTPMTIYEV